MPPSQPHDALFHHAWSDLPTARSHFQAVLPADVVAAVDWSTLTVQPGSFVDEALLAVRSDLLFSARTRSGATLKIYLLFEHQRTPDPLIPFRLLRYMVRIWDAQLRADPPEPLVPILPLVLYHGQKPWSVASDLAGMLGLEGDDEARFGRYTPRFQYALQDLSTVPDAALEGTALGRLALLLFKHVDDPDLWALLARWRKLLLRVQRETAGGLLAVRAIWQYVAQVVARPPDPALIRELGRDLGSNTEDQMVSWADQLREEGRKQEREDGARRAVRRVLAARFPSQDLSWLADALASLDPQALDEALTHAARARSPAAFRAALPRATGAG